VRSLPSDLCNPSVSGRGSVGARVRACVRACVRVSQCACERAGRGGGNERESDTPPVGWLT
jgi:hypothetical protein